LEHAEAPAAADTPEGPIHNLEVAEILSTLADLLEIEGENPFRVRAYRNAARVVADLPESVESMLAEGRDLTELRGIGRDLAGKIEEIARTGHLGLLDEARARTPGGLAELVTLPGLGPKRARALHDELGVTTLEELARAARAHEVQRLYGFGRLTEERILEALARRVPAETRLPLAAAERVAAPLVEHLRQARRVREVVVAGSYRRRRETVRDLDLLVTCTRGSDVMDRFVAFPDVEEVLAKGPTRSTVRLRSGLQVDLRVVPEESYGAALHYFTGSKAHNIATRRMAIEKGLKLNEYGVFRDGRRVAGRTEEEVYREVGLPYIAPELRESRGEIEAAHEGRLPVLVEEGDILGDLHAHTTASDGASTLREMAEAALARGYEYLAITDHARRGRPALGRAGWLARQMEEIDRLNAELDGIVLLKSAEVEILVDGSLGLPHAVLERLDLAVCAIHHGLGLSRDRQTARLLRAMESPHLTILAHPTGRLLGRREPCELDMTRVMEAARERGCVLELNAHPSRLDLDDVHCKMAKEMGVRVAISTDAHRASDLDLMRFGVDQARRGWLERDDVINTRPWTELAGLLGERGRGLRSLPAR
jgi:DNA polymerase (family 10)